MSDHRLPTEVVIRLVYDGQSDTGVKVEPIVYCKDCVFYMQDEAYKEPWCEYIWRGTYGEGRRIVRDNDYCSRGQRK